MTTFEAEFYATTVLLLVEASVYLGLAVWVLNRRDGRWSTLVAVGAGLIGVVLGLNALATAEVVFLDTSYLFETIFIHVHVQTLTTVARCLGAALLAAGVIESRRTPPERSLYGPPTTD